MDIKKIYKAPLLAQATYADGLVSGSTGTPLKNDLIDLDLNSDDVGVADGITNGQADFIANNYRVIHQESNPATGFSATLFEDVNNQGQYYLALREENGVKSLIYDSGAASLQFLLCGGGAYGQANAS